MTSNPAHEVDTVCYKCGEPFTTDHKLKSNSFRCPECNARLSKEHYHKGPENIGQIRLNPSTEQIDIDRLRSLLEDNGFVLDTSEPEPPEGAQQLGITIYRNYFPPENHR